MIELRIPASGDAVSEVQLVEWVVSNGQAVAEGETIYTVESDKATVEVPSPSSGTIEILERAGEVFSVGHLVGRVA